MKIQKPTNKTKQDAIAYTKSYCKHIFRFSQKFPKFLSENAWAMQFDNQKSIGIRDAFVEVNQQIDDGNDIAYRTGIQTGSRPQFCVL